MNEDLKAQAEARKKKLFNRVLIVSAVTALAMFVGYNIVTKRPNMKYFVPRDYEGWVTIRYEVEEAPALPLVDGEYELYIPNSGILETSNRYQFGWRREEYYFWDGKDPSTAVFMNKWEKQGDETEPHGHIHSLHEQHIDTLDVLAVVEADPSLEDTTLWDGTRISIKGEQMDVSTGRDLFQHFYLSKERQPFEFKHPELARERRRR